MNKKLTPINKYRPYWAKRFGTAPILPMNRAEMELLGWDSCDIIIVTGDAYVDHPSFGMGLIGRILEAQGFRVGIIAQPDWRKVEDFQVLGKPNLFWGVTAGNMDSMVNHYTSDRKIRSNDSYTPDGEAGKRPDRSVIVYAQKVRQAYKAVPVIIGGIEASLRRIAHYDYWSNKVRRSVLPDSKADMLIYGNAERALIEVAHRLGRGILIKDIQDVRGTAFMCNETPVDWIEIDSRQIDKVKKRLKQHPNPYASETPANCQPSSKNTSSPVVTFDHRPKKMDRERCFIRLPSYDDVVNDDLRYAHASRLFHLETNPGNARALVQKHGKRDVWLNPPPIPLSTVEMDWIFDLPYTRNPHPSYGKAKNPAWEMIRFSINIMRGCFGGCTFCSITEHEGRIIQSRSEDSVIREIESIRDQVPDFKGTISDLGGPTANMYQMKCKDSKIEAACRRPSCVYPGICKNLNTSHDNLIKMYRRARNVSGVKRVLIASGLRYDLAVQSPEYVKELVTHHVGGYLKIAPEHTEEAPLSKMLKPGIGTYERFKKIFEQASKAAGKEQYLIPYFISAHPGTSDEDMMNLAIWLKKNDFRLNQVQAFLPTPLATASTMYHTGRNPLKKITKDAEVVSSVREFKQRRLHKAFLRYHDPDNWELLRTALKKMGRSDLIGNTKKHLVPSWQPKSTQKLKKDYSTKKYKNQARTNGYVRNKGKK